MPRRRVWLRSLLLAGGLLAASGCGFRLRGPQNLAFKTLYANFAPGSVLGSQLRRQLAASGVTLLTQAPEAKDAQLLMDVLSDQRERVVVGVTSSGQVRELQLRLRLRFQVRAPGQDAPVVEETELLQQRDVSYTESIALAKEAEAAMLYRDMENDLIQQLLRRLAAIGMP